MVSKLKPREKSSDPILWPNGTKKFKTKEEPDFFDAVDLMRRKREQDDEAEASLLEIATRQKVFEEVIITRIKTLQNNLQIVKSTAKR